MNVATGIRSERVSAHIHEAGEWQKNQSGEGSLSLIVGEEGTSRLST